VKGTFFRSDVIYDQKSLSWVAPLGKHVDYLYYMSTKGVLFSFSRGNRNWGDDWFEMQVYTEVIDLVRAKKVFRAALCCCFFSMQQPKKELIQYLHTQERNYYNTLTHEKRIRSYLIGRYVAKQAVAAVTGEVDLTNICIESGVFTQPIVVSGKQNIQVSITHCEHCGAAIAFPEAHPMGIDIEKINPAKRYVLESQITENEQKQIRSREFSYDTGLALLWTAKEAISKVLKTGFMVPLQVFEISKIQLYDHYMITYYKNFAQYKAISFSINSYMCSIVCPLRTETGFDIYSYQGKISLV